MGRSVSIVRHRSAFETHNIAAEGDSDLLPMLDVRAPRSGVDVTVSHDQKSLWVNIDGMCVLRVEEIPHLAVFSPAPKEET